MPIGTAVHDRTFALAGSLNFREWSGYYAVSAYETHHQHEYNAIRNASALIDVSPLFKYLIRGRDAVKLVDRVITRDASNWRSDRCSTHPGATSTARSSTMGP
jgi:aminomethyltransferase